MIEPTFSSEAPAAATPAPEEGVTTALYRAAIGPVNGNYYLPIFTRFEAADHAGISWNTAASLTTLTWLAFRQLWTAALAYVGIMVAVALLVFGIGRLVFQFSDTLMMALGLGFGLAAFVLPGLFGNAVLHTECRKKMSSALTAHTEVADACAQLNRRAPTRQRAIWLACANVAFWVAAVFSYVQISALSTLAVMPHGALEAGHVAVGKTTDLTAPLALPPTPTAPASESTTAASASSSALASAPAAPTAAASAASAPAAPVASAPVAAASTALPASASATPVVAVSAPAPRTVASVPATKTSASKTEPKASAPAKAERVKKEVEPTVVRAKKAQTPTATEAPKRKASAAASVTVTKTADASDKPYFINVGLFAIPENAASAHAKLLEAQLPSVLKELKSTKGRQIRVRVGPYRSKTDAQAAVEKIKALQLDAVIVQL
ncbi:MAG: SPOR domain-containing protein [Rhodoferax sp.]|nr:SPOR domain-containing protein [Rhodoferax sp.]